MSTKAPVKKKAATKAKKPVKKVAVGSTAKLTKPKEAKVVEREVIYPDIKVQVCVGDKALTEAQAKRLLLWEEEPAKPKDKNAEPVTFGAQYMLVDNDGKKIRCYNNGSYHLPDKDPEHAFSNRQFYPQLAKTYEGEFLHKRWRVNGETLIIGKTGMTLSAQHRLVAFILACQEWRKNPDRWTMWDSEPTMECIIVFGIDEDDETVNTIDTGKTRSLSDVIFRSELIRDYKESDRKTLAAVISFAIKTVADRTGAWVNAFSPKRTHGEMIHFLDRHPGILACAKDIFEESEGKTDKTLVTLGVAAGLMYLMKASATDPANYTVAEVPTESSIDFSNEDKGREFWIELIQRKFPALINVFGQFTQDSQTEDDVESNGGTPAERIATVIKAWLCYVAGKPITEDTLKLVYHVEDGIRTLAECPTVGGIDHGNARDSADVVPPTPEELEQRKAVVDADAQSAKANGKPTKKAVKKVVKPIKEGDIVYVVTDAENGIWYGGELMEKFEIGKGKFKARINITIPKNLKGKTEEAAFEQLTLTRPS